MRGRACTCAHPCLVRPGERTPLPCIHWPRGSICRCPCTSPLYDGAPAVPPSSCRRLHSTQQLNNENNLEPTGACVCVCAPMHPHAMHEARRLLAQIAFFHTFESWFLVLVFSNCSEGHGLCDFLEHGHNHSPVIDPHLTGVELHVVRRGECRHIDALAVTHLDRLVLGPHLKTRTGET